MAENSDAVYKLLNQLLEAYTPTAQKEYLEVQELARQEQVTTFCCHALGLELLFQQTEKQEIQYQRRNAPSLL